MINKTLTAVFAASALTLSLVGCDSSNKPAAEPAKPAETPAAETTAETNSNKAAIVGSWHLSKVLVSEKEGENPTEVQEEDHASMFGEKNNVYTFAEDGTGTFTIVGGGDTVEKEATWITEETGSYKVTSDGIEETYIYDPVDDTLTREYIGENPYIHVLTVFARQ
ncbi:MAG: hypothetical protein IKD66_14500 [Solobacterium sp.]|nr:hypothetical protein [Solobacterium sp.]